MVAPAVTLPIRTGRARRVWRVPLWWLVGAAAALGLAGMAFWGEDRSGSLAQNTASGLMKDTLPSQVRVLELSASGRPAVRYVRADESAPWQRVAGDARRGVDAPLSLKLGELIMLLHNSAPERSLATASSELAAYGLTPGQALRVSVATSDSAGATPVLRVDLGGKNPMGLSTYSRLVAAPQAQADVLLLPSYLADAASALLPAP